MARETQSINLVGAFEDAIDTQTGRIAASIQRLTDHARDLHQAFDEQPVSAWAFGVGDKKIAPLAELAQRSTFDTTVTEVGTLVAGRLAAKP